MIKKNETDPSIALIKYFILKVASLKYLYITSIVLFVSVAILFNKYSHKIYEVNASISPIQNNASSLLSSNDLFRGIESLRADRNIENEINNLNSFALVYSTITKMNLEVGYFTEKNKLFKQTTELYRRSPFSVNIDKSHVQPIDCKFYIYILDNSSFRLTSSQKEISLYNYVDNLIVSENNVLEIDTICRFNETIINRNFKFSISLHNEYQVDKLNSKDLYYFQFHHLDYLTIQYLGRLRIDKVSPLASIIKIRFRGENIEKSIDFLNKFVDSYLEDNLAKKNKIAVSTINFIDSQLSEISDSLVLSESRLRNYRSAYQVMDLSYQGQRIYEQMTQIETERANLEVQERYYNYIINYFKTNKDMSGVVPPSSMNVVDPIMNQLITDLLALNAQRSSILSYNNEKNLFLNQIENKIKIQKQAIIENVTNNLNTLSLSLNELNYRSDKLSKEMATLPKTELNMVGMQRKFNLNDVIFTFLLQKRSEAAITLASNYPDYEILEPARGIQSFLVAPKKNLLLFISVFFALLIPTIYIFVKDLFSDKISNFYDIEHLITRSVLGIIYSNRQASEKVVIEYPNSLITESFRNLRSSLFFKLKLEQSKVIVVTSSQPQDGKSFISLNLASSIASVGHQTIIIDGDLRRPTLHDKFKEDNSKGISSYMIKNTSMDKIIFKTSFENLSFIPAGPILPNPSELIESGNLDDLINFLKSKYEYIIIDTSPVGLVADSFQLMKYATQILLVSRNNFTRKDMLANALNLLNASNFIKYDVILNDMNLDKSPYKHYGSYYRKE